MRSPTPNRHIAPKSSVRGREPGSSIDELFEKAAINEQILNRYQSFELKLLDATSLEQLLQNLLHDSLEAFQLEATELWLYDPQHTLQELIADKLLNHSGLRLVANHRELLQLYGETPEVTLASRKYGEEINVLSNSKIGSAALLPLIRQGVLVGSLHLGAKRAQRFAAEVSTDFVSHLARVVAVCFENAVNRDRLQRLSMYDVLTQVKNRRAFHMALDKEISRASRGDDPLSLLFIDLDHFKSINDTYGHPMGDKVLKTVAQSLQKSMRIIDHVCRYGGEEFALILPNCPPDMAVEIADRLRQKICELAIANDEEPEKLGDTIKTSLSIGACCWKPGRVRGNVDGKEIAKKLVASSDRGVYDAKAAGRNTVCFVDMDAD